MGRYTNVQSYSDDSPSMRTVSYAQATTGRAEGNAEVESSPSRQPPRCTSNEKRDGEGADDVVAKKSAGAPAEPESISGKNGDAEQSQQTREPGAASAPICDNKSLFVGGLHPRIGDLHLQKLFSPYGEIVRINIVTHSPNAQPSSHSKSAIPAHYKALQKSKGYAFVEYRTIESASLAMSRLDGRELMGRRLAVRPSRRKMGDAAGTSGSGATEVTTEEAKRQYGAVESKIEAVKRAIEEKKRGI